MSWNQVLPKIWLYCDCCNVYAVQAPDGMVIVDAGSGRWLQSVNELPAKPVALVLTHYFRDHAAGAAAAAEAGIPVWVPEYEREIISDPAEHFRRRETYIIYDNVWDLFAPVLPTPIEGVLRDYERVELAGLSFEVLPLPGATITQIGLCLALEGKRLAFCGETIHSPGKIARVAPLQYNYNDLPGAVNVHASAQWLRDHKPDVLLPSLGKPILVDADRALESVQEAMRKLCVRRPAHLKSMDLLKQPSVSRVSEHLWQSQHAVSTNWFLTSESGKCLALDYGYTFPITPMGMAHPPSRRRALLHSVEGLREAAGIEKIDVVLVSHYHDDHVAGIPLLQRVFGTECWAPEVFVDLLEQPEAHCFPCNWPRAARVNRRIKLDETVEWEGYKFHFRAMNGHTRFSALIGFEADGVRYAHTGDQYFFQSSTGCLAETSMGRWAGQTIFENHVFRNGALLGGLAQSAQWMLDWRPDVVLTGHTDPMQTDAAFFEILEEWGREYDRMHREVMPLGDEEAHFNIDSWGGWIWPYRTHLAAPGTLEVQVTVRNPWPREAELELELQGPRGWDGEKVRVRAGARAEVSVPMRMQVPAICRHQPFAVELVADGQPFGQVAEGLVTAGGEYGSRQANPLGG